VLKNGVTCYEKQRPMFIRFIYSHMDTKYKIVSTGDWSHPSKLLGVLISP